MSQEIQPNATQEVPKHEISIWEAAISGNLDILRKYIEDEQNIDAKPTKKSVSDRLEPEQRYLAPIHLAIIHKQPAILKELIENNADLEVPASKRYSEKTPLNLAIALRDAESINLLLQYGGAELMYSDYDDVYDHHTYIADVIKEFIVHEAMGYPPKEVIHISDNVVDIMIDTFPEAVDIIIARGRVEKFTQMLDAFLNVNNRITFYDSEPAEVTMPMVIYAAITNQLAMVKLLVERGANLNIISSRIDRHNSYDGSSIMEHVLDRGDAKNVDFEIIKYLIEKMGVDCTVISQSADDYSPQSGTCYNLVLYLSKHDKIEALRWLIEERGLNIEHVWYCDAGHTRMNVSIFTMACNSRSLLTAQYLLDKGAHVSCEDFIALCDPYHYKDLPSQLKHDIYKAFKSHNTDLQIQEFISNMIDPRDQELAQKILIDSEKFYYLECTKRLGGTQAIAADIVARSINTEIGDKKIDAAPSLAQLDTDVTTKEQSEECDIAHCCTIGELSIQDDDAL